MTAREMTTSLGALVLGLAIAGAVPALAQTTAPGAATTPRTSAPASPAPQAAPATPGHMNMNMNMTHPHMAATHHRNRRRLARRSAPNSTNANAQDADVDRLNQESLQAAQQGKAYAPSGNM
jgi:hypothetical protein